MIELYKQPKTKTKKEHIRLVIVSIGVDVVPKTDDEMYVISIIKIYSFHLFFLLCQRKSNCWKYRKWCSYFENAYHNAKIVDKKRIIFWPVLTAPCCFHKRNYQVSWRSFGICPLQFPDRLHYDRARTSALKYYCQCYKGYLLPCQKSAIKILKQNVKFVQTFFYRSFGCPKANFGPLTRR